MDALCNNQSGNHGNHGEHRVIVAVRKRKNRVDARGGFHWLTCSVGGGGGVIFSVRDMDRVRCVRVIVMINTYDTQHILTIDG